MTGTAILLALTLVTLAVFLLAEHRDEIRAWVAREPLDLDHEDGLRAPSSFYEQEPMPRDGVLDALAKRLDVAQAVLDELSRKRGLDAWESGRLTGKAQGVRLALSYIEDAKRGVS